MSGIFDTGIFDTGVFDHLQVSPAPSGGTPWLGSFNYRRQVELVKKSPVKKVRAAAKEVAAYLDTGEISQAAIARQAVDDAVATLRTYADPELMAVARDEAIIAIRQKERAKVLAQLEAWQQLLADDDEAIVALLLN